MRDKCRRYNMPERSVLLLPGYTIVIQAIRDKTAVIDVREADNKVRGSEFGGFIIDDPYGDPELTEVQATHGRRRPQTVVVEDKAQEDGE